MLGTFVWLINSVRTNPYPLLIKFTPFGSIKKAITSHMPQSALG